MNQVDKLIGPAIEAIKREQALSPDGKKVWKEYAGYISSFGAAVLQSGLIPAIAFFSHQDSASGGEVGKGSARPRKPLMDLIFKLLSPSLSLDPKVKSLLDYAISVQQENHPGQLRRLQRKVLDSSIALKLAIRTFKLEKEAS